MYVDKEVIATFERFPKYSSPGWWYNRRCYLSVDEPSSVSLGGLERCEIDSETYARTVVGNWDIV
jgi:hypothetical protein